MNKIETNQQTRMNQNFPLEYTVLLSSTDVLFSVICQKIMTHFILKNIFFFYSSHNVFLSPSPKIITDSHYTPGNTKCCSLQNFATNKL